VKISFSIHFVGNMHPALQRNCYLLSHTFVGTCILHILYFGRKLVSYTCWKLVSYTLKVEGEIE